MRRFSKQHRLFQRGFPTLPDRVTIGRSRERRRMCTPEPRCENRLVMYGNVTISLPGIRNSSPGFLTMCSTLGTAIDYRWPQGVWCQCPRIQAKCLRSRQSRMRSKSGSVNSILYLEWDLQLFLINRKWSQKWRKFFVQCQTSNVVFSARSEGQSLQMKCAQKEVWHWTSNSAILASLVGICSYAFTIFCYLAYILWKVKSYQKTRLNLKKCLFNISWNTSILFTLFIGISIQYPFCFSTIW